MNSLFKTIFWVKLSFSLEALSPGKTEQWTWRGESFPVLLTNGPLNAILWVELSYQLIKALSARVPEHWMCREFPCVTNEWPFQANLLSKSIICTHWNSVSQESWRMNVQDFMCILFIMFQIIPLLTLQHKYACHIANICHTAIMLNKHIDPIYFPISTKIKLNEAATSHIIAKYGPETNMPLKFHIYMTQVNYFMCTFQMNTSVYIYIIWTYCDQQCDHKHCYT